MPKGVSAFLTFRQTLSAGYNPRFYMVLFMFLQKEKKEIKKCANVRKIFFHRSQYVYL